MCNLCKGTRVVHDDNHSSVTFQTCPNCGPYQEGFERENRYRQVRGIIEMHKIRLGIKSA